MGAHRELPDEPHEAVTDQKLTKLVAKASPLQPAVALLHEPDEIDKLYEASEPKPGCPGVRIDAEGREWYSSRWL